MSCREVEHWFGPRSSATLTFSYMVNAQARRFVPSRNGAGVDFLWRAARNDADIFSGASVSRPGEIVGPARLGGEGPALLQGLLDQSPRGVICRPGGCRPRGEFAAGGEKGAG